MKVSAALLLLIPPPANDNWHMQASHLRAGTFPNPSTAATLCRCPTACRYAKAQLCSAPAAPQFVVGWCLFAAGQLNSPAGSQGIKHAAASPKGRRGTFSTCGNEHVLMDGCWCCINKPIHKYPRRCECSRAAALITRSNTCSRTGRQRRRPPAACRPAHCWCRSRWWKPCAGSPAHGISRDLC